ncbi:hypothetical protein V7S43_003222 [Phytophthora oleae]|uniref:Cell growth-regulating nucleolar protein-like winged helix domain-containing protein n=1 Tax=Phytophthora oleae TaxID=2107226 RepID=A0ABD3FZS6_9STRA
MDVVLPAPRAKSKTDDKLVKWSKLIKSALKGAGKELDMDALRDQVVKQIQNSGKSEKELKESEKFSVVEVVRLKCGNEISTEAKSGERFRQQHNSIGGQ